MSKKSDLEIRKSNSEGAVANSEAVQPARRAKPPGWVPNLSREDSRKSDAEKAAGNDFLGRLDKVIGSEKPFAWAKKVGIPNGTMDAILYNYQIPSAKHLVRIKDTTGVSIDWLLTGDDPRPSSVADIPDPFHDLAIVPRLDVRSSAGGGALANSDRVLDRVAFPPEWLRRLGVPISELAIVENEGDSMLPTIEDGDPMLIHTKVDRIAEGVIYVLQVGETTRTKRLQLLMNGAVNIISDNARYPVESLSPDEARDINVRGRVLRVLSRP